MKFLTEENLVGARNGAPTAIPKTFTLLVRRITFLTRDFFSHPESYAYKTPHLK